MATLSSSAAAPAFPNAAGEPPKGHAAPLAVLTGLDDGLQEFQRVEVVGFEGSSMNGDGFFDPRRRRDVERRPALGEGKRTARHQRDLHRAGHVVHLLGPIPTVREMLVGEEGNDPLGFPHHSGDLVEEALARKENLIQLVLVVAAALADGKDAIDSQCIPTEAESAGDRVISGDLVVANHTGGKISLEVLIAPHRNDFERRTGIDPLAAEIVGFEKVFQDHVGVRPMGERRVDGRDFERSGALRLAGGEQSRRRGAGPQEVTP